MKNIFLVLTLAFGLFARAEDSFTVCGPYDSVGACDLGKNVLQSLLVVQDRNEIPKDLNIPYMISLLKANQLNLSASAYKNLDRKGQVNLIYKSLVQGSGQSLPVLRPSLGVDAAEKKGGVSMSTGSRGGGTDLPDDLWY